MNRVGEYENKKKLAVHNDPNIIFIHIPKTGGKSIREGLFGKMEAGTGHASIRAYDGICLQNYYKFSVIRDPVDRIRSLYRFTHDRKKDGYWNIPILQSKTFNDFCEKLPKLYKEWNHPGIFPQNFWITDRSGEVVVDDLFEFGRMDIISDTVQKKTGAVMRIKHRNKSSNNRCSTNVSRQSVDIIKEIYSDDFKIYEQVLRDNNG